MGQSNFSDCFSSSFLKMEDLQLSTLHILVLFFARTRKSIMVAPPPPPNLGGELKISDQNNWGELSKKLNLGGGGTKFKGGPMNIVAKGGHIPLF